MSDPLVLNRLIYSDNSTISDLLIEGEKFCDVLELSCRKGNDLGRMAIRAGRYSVGLDWSPHWQRKLWHLFQVPSDLEPGTIRQGIMIHPANYPSELEGCLAPGIYDPAVPDFIGGSRATHDRLFMRLIDLKTEIGNLWITVNGGSRAELAA